MASKPQRFAWARNLAVLLVAWELAGRLGLVASGALPAPSAILAQLWADRGDYPSHVMATLQASKLQITACSRRRYRKRQLEAQEGRVAHSM